MLKLENSSQFQDQWLVDALIDAGIMERSTFETLAARYPDETRFFEVLTKSNFLKPLDIAHFVNKFFQVPFIDLDAVSFDPEIRLLVPEEVCRRYQLLPFKLEGREVAVAIGEMLNVEGERLVEYLTGKHVTPYFAFQDQIEARIREYYAGETGSSPDTGGEATPYTLRIQGERSGETGSPIVDLVNRIIGEAIHREASDIHIEPKENKVVVRIRVDGVLRKLMEIPKENQQAVVSRIKIISNLDIADSRRPQDGKAKVVYNDHNIDLRVSTVPTNLGEKVVIRILDSRKAKVSFEQLGVRGRNLELLEQCFRFKEGMVLVTGPTGSGKSTTLYAALNRLRSTTNNIMTIEDPVEYRLEGINQVQVNEKAGVTFAAALRSFLRQDPDVILVGEIRDRETAEIAVQAALTGHLVLSTLHTNDAFATLTRLMDMGVDAVKAGEAVQAVIAQRLVRRLCTQCRLETEPDEMEKKLIPLMKRLNCEPRFFRARGCPHCGFTGYKGRIGVYEILILDNDLKAMILRQAPLYEVRKAAREKGFRNLYEDALNLISEGITDYREVLRVIHPDSDQAVELEAIEPVSEAPAPAEEPLQEVKPPAEEAPLPVTERESPAEAPPPDTARSESASATLLLVEDSRTLRAIARKFLETKTNWKVLEAADGLEGLNVLEHHSVDAIVLDLKMPHMDGFEFLERIRGNPSTAGIPVVILSGMEGEYITRGMKLGADDYLIKPFDGQALIEKIRNLLDRSRILIVEDNKTMRKMARRIIEKKTGWQVYEVEDGLQALEFLKDHPVDAIVLDLMMPNMDGFEFLQHLRFNPETALIPVLIVTALEGEDSELKSLELGADDYLVKPYKASILIARLRRLLERAGEIRQKGKSVKAA